MNKKLVTFLANQSESLYKNLHYDFTKRLAFDVNQLRTEDILVSNLFFLIQTFNLIYWTIKLQQPKNR